MNEGLSEVDVMEREEAGRPLGAKPPAGGKRHAPPPSHARKRSGRVDLSILSLAISVIALLVAGTALFPALREGKEPEDAPELEEPNTFRFGDMVLTPLEGMPLNPYDKEGFGLDEKGRVTYELNGRRAKSGIDVSTHQKDIDWQAVAEDGIDFVILRLGHRGYTEGGLFLDQTFAQNLQGALDAGLEVGVYFFSQSITPEEAEEEADYVLDTLNGQELAFPVAFDWESISGDEARTDGLDGETMTRCAAAFCKRVENAGYRPAVYFNRTQGYLRYDLRELTDYELWLAEYNAPPDFYYHFDLWQYSHTGRVDGIQGDVDMDLAF
ncbi:MAG: hypothetical protein HFG02_07170 [Oscillibacter sp.]|nr:hypothetical protein [Oscillibacter sp.]